MDITTAEINGFINDYVKDLRSGNASVFVGAGISRGAGYVDWKGLLSEIAESLNLDINKEYDLLSIAQYHVNKHGRTRINKKILEEFTEENEETENHRILARLPFRTIWTTNYDNLIEDTCNKYNKIVDDKYSVDKLFLNRPKADLILYKMHGDIESPGEAILTKEDYEGYFNTHEPFITTLSGELISKTFLFIGFSFTDPNIDHVLSRLNFKYKAKNREHYCLLKKYNIADFNNDQAELDYNLRKQQLFISELKRFGITTILIEDYSDITAILSEIEKRYNSHSVFISGSAIEYGEFTPLEAQSFIHLLSKEIIKKKLNVINGFGLGVGSAVINGALDAVYSENKKYSENQLVLKPFPQFPSGVKDLKQLWEEYRHNMISRAGIIVILFGNIETEDGIINADGVKIEFQIAIEKGLIPIPIFYTGYMAQEIFEDIVKDYSDYNLTKELFNAISNLKFDKDDLNKSIREIISIIQKIAK
ncbi:SIR2 family protein [Flavobacterium denitrificans]|uniref:SIR2 family protein n=1 Tax=Flavobacterium denitrificans TaxID=281361 RepID=UPI0004059D66|nr:SIR2 family protein [Flavobacterium denitrificans]